jgi:hypothetical protein
MELDEKIFELAFKSLNGKPANGETFCTIVRACAGPGIIWVQAAGQLTGASDEQCITAFTELAREELARARKNKELLQFGIPKAAQH